MHHHYGDILDKITVPPLWFDEHAVPRFCEFAPKQVADIYADSCCLLLIDCQGCGREFRVAMSDSKTQRIIRQHYGRPSPSLTELVRNGSIHYGDPPNIGCCPAGPSMNSVPRRVIEYWTRAFASWERIAELEIDIPCDWANGDD